MAENTFTTLSRTKIIVGDKGQRMDIEFPDWMPSDLTYDSAELLLEWAKEHNLLHALLQAGIRQEIIGLRAAIRPTGERQKFELAECTERAQAYRPKVQVRPTASGGKITADSLKKSGLSKEDLLALIATL